MDRLDAGEGEKAHGPGFDKRPGRIHFLIRRLHSLMGLVFGGYIVVHLLVNATGIWPRDYQMNVDKIHTMEPMLWLIELTVIFIPLLIHALYGIYIVKAGVKFNTTKYAYGGNVRYTLQRWTAVFLLAFIAFHIGTLHKWGLAGIHDLIEWTHPAQGGTLAGIADWCARWGGVFQPHDQAFQSTVMGLRSYFYDPEHPGHIGIANGAVMAFYLLGIWSACFHLGNGLWTSAIAWGLTMSAKSQKRWGHVCLVITIVVAICGTTAWYAFTISPKARGDLSRWDEVTHTLPDESAVHEPDQSTVQMPGNPNSK